MAILGTLVDVATFTRAGDNLSNGVAFATLAHSLPTTPESVAITLTSKEALDYGDLDVFYFGSSGNINTIGVRAASQASAPAVAAKVTSIVYHSVIR